MNVYDKASAEDIRDGLRVVTKALLSSNLLPTAPKQPDGSKSAA
jgi:hypothetical protein